MPAKAGSPRAAVLMADRDSAKCRRIVVDTHSFINPAGRKTLICHVCKCWIDLIKDTTRWRADHIRRKAQGGDDTAENLWPICLDCDAGEHGKAAHDTSEIAKGVRVFEKHNGIKRASRPMAGSRRSTFKRKMDGTTVRRS